MLDGKTYEGDQNVKRLCDEIAEYEGIFTLAKKVFMMKETLIELGKLEDCDEEQS